LEEWRSLRGIKPPEESNMLRTLICKEADIRRIRAVSNMEALCREQLRMIGKDPSLYVCVVMVAIAAEQGAGRQPIHSDMSQLDRAQQCFTFLLYCTQTIATGVLDPSIAYTDTLDAFQEDVPKATRDLLSQRNFCCPPVEPGTLLCMRCSAFHAPLPNPHSHKRVLCCAMFVPKSLPPFDYYDARYPHGIPDN
jgi:hypothetical protein